VNLPQVFQGALHREGSATAQPAGKPAPSSAAPGAFALASSRRGAVVTSTHAGDRSYGTRAQNSIA
jgi:hypothetical protein